MSRKARLTVYRDKLEAISGCPITIFNQLQPSDLLFDVIKNAEAGDVGAMEELVAKLHSSATENNEPSEALVYFARMGLAAKSPLCAALFICYIELFNTEFDCLDEAIETMKGSDKEELLVETVKMAKLKRILSAPSRERDFEKLIADAETLDIPCMCEIRMYLEAQALAYLDTPLSEELYAIVKYNGYAPLLALPIFKGKSEAIKHNTATKCETLRRILTLFDIGEWRDFWLKVIFEYAEVYLGGDLSVFIEDMLNIVNARQDYREKPMHKWAMKKYALTHGIGSYTADVCDALEMQCRFIGLTLPDSTEEIIRDAVYAERMPCAIGDSSLYDAEILHERNRYTLTMVLSDHKKRASRHQWDCTLAIRTDSDTPPVIASVPITERRAEISRNGVTLTKEKKASQVLCAGEIKLADKVSPFEIDLILDISYVSSTKCTHCGIKFERVKRQGDLLIMQTAISLYNET